MTSQGYQEKAQQRWPEAVWIHGNGAYASVSYLAHAQGDEHDGRSITIMLHTTRGAAEEAKKYIDELGCGGRNCSPAGHEVVCLREEKR